MNPIQSFSSFKAANDSAKETAMEENRKKEYGEAFATLLKEYGVTSPAELDEEKKAEFFKKIEEVINSKDNPNPEGFPPPGGMSDDVPAPDEEEEDEEEAAAEITAEAHDESGDPEEEDPEEDEEHYKDAVKDDEEHIDDLEKDMEDDEEKEKDAKDLEEAVVTEEAEVNSDEEFMEYAMTVLKKAFGDKFDESKAKETAEGILSKVDGDYGAAIGMLTSGLGESNEVSEDTAAEIEKEIVDMGKPEELKQDDALVTDEQPIAEEPKAEADDTKDAIEVPVAKGDGSETAAGIAGDMMDMGKPKEEPASKGEELVSDDQEITATVERRVMDFTTFVNESYNQKEKFLNEAKGSSNYQFNVYSDWSEDANSSTKLTVYAVPSNIAESAIKKYKWEVDDYNGMDEKKFGSLGWKKYAIKEFGLDDIQATWSVTPWDEAFKKKTGSFADNVIEIELE